MQDMTELMDHLNLTGKRLSKGHRKIAAYIMEHYDKAVFMTASKLGESVDVSESTVVRFATVLGYEGYPQLQRAMQQLVSHRLTANQRFEMSSDIQPSAALSTVLKSDITNLRATMEQLDKNVFDDVVNRLLGARRIYIMGLRSAAPLAQFMGYYMHYIFDDVRLVSSGSTDVFEEISRITSNDVLFGISFPRYSTRTLQAMRFAKARGAQVVSLTDGPMSPLNKASDACLMARTDMASFVDSLAAPLSVINALLVALGLHRKEQMSNYFKQLQGIWDEYSVYLEEDGRHA